MIFSEENDSCFENRQQIRAEAYIKNIYWNRELHNFGPNMPPYLLQQSILISLSTCFLRSYHHYQPTFLSQKLNYFGNQASMHVRTLIHFRKHVKSICAKKSHQVCLSRLFPPLGYQPKSIKIKQMSISDNCCIMRFPDIPGFPL